MVLISYKRVIFSLEKFESFIADNKEDEHVLDSLKIFLRLGINPDNRQLPYKVFNPIEGIYFVEIEEKGSA